MLRDLKLDVAGGLETMNQEGERDVSIMSLFNMIYEQSSDERENCFVKNCLLNTSR